MAFPKAPDKPVVGGLTLVVRPPVTNEQPDLAADMKISLPSVFSVSKTVEETINEQEIKALKDLENIKKSCASCHQVTDTQTFLMTKELILYIYSFLQEKEKMNLMLITSINSDKSLTVTLSNENKSIVFDVYSGSIEGTRFLEDKKTGQIDFRLLSTQLEDELNWLVG